MIYLALALLIVFLLWCFRNLAREILSLPVFWWKALSASTQGISIKQHRFGQHKRQYYIYCQSEKQPNTKRGIIIYFHGGGWKFGKPGQFFRHARLLSELGFDVVLPSYRRIPFSRFPEIREDLNNFCIRFHQELSQQKKEALPIIVGGMSAGGNLAALLAFGTEKYPIPFPIKGLFLFGAPLALNAMKNSLYVQSYAGRPKSEIFKAANPINYLSDEKAIALPTLIIYGGKDGMVPTGAVLPFAERLKMINKAPTEVLYLPDFSHIEVASWVFEKQPIRPVFFKWLNYSQI